MRMFTRNPFVGFKLNHNCQTDTSMLNDIEARANQLANKHNSYRGVSGKPSFISLMNNFNKTETAIFPCKLCFLRAIPLISFL